MTVKELLDILESLSINWMGDYEVFAECPEGSGSWSIKGAAKMHAEECVVFSIDKPCGPHLPSGGEDGEA